MLLLIVFFNIAILAILFIIYREFLKIKKDIKTFTNKYDNDIASNIKKLYSLTLKLENIQLELVRIKHMLLGRVTKESSKEVKPKNTKKTTTKNTTKKNVNSSNVKSQM